MSEAVQVLRALNAVVISALALWCWAQWRKGGDQSTRWAALAFAVLSVIAVVGLVLPDGVQRAGFVWLRKAAVTLFLVFPYLLFRFSAFFRRPPRIVENLAAALTVVLVVWTLLLPPIPTDDAPRPGWFGPYVAMVLVPWSALSLWVAGLAGLPTTVC